MNTKMTLLEKQNIRDKIYTIRDKQVILDRDLANLYLVETRILNQAVKRNKKRFPTDFMFQLTADEHEKILRSQIVISKLKERGGLRYLPYAFTEQGVAMLSATLKSWVAIDASIKIIRAFVDMRKFLSQNAMIFQKFDYIEQKLLGHDQDINKIFKRLEKNSYSH